MVRTERVAAPTQHAMATGPFGSAISSKFFVSDGVPVIRGGNLSAEVGDRLSHDKLVFLDADRAARFSRSVVRRGDLVFTCWGTIGQVGLIDRRAKYDEYVVSNKQMKLTPDHRIADSLYLYYAFSSPMVLAAIQGQAIGSSVPGFNLGQLKAISIPLPPLAEQRRIAAVLGALDDKIELNRQMNRTLEEMAQALFKSWFIDFDGHDDLVDSELGPIPRGWRWGTPRTLVRFNPRLKLSKGTSATYIEMKALPTEGCSITYTANRQYKGGAKFQNRDTLLARITPCLENGKTALVQDLDDGEVAFGSTEFIVMRPKDTVPESWVYCLARSAAFRAHAIANMTGSSGRQRVPVDCFDGFGIAVPDEQSLRQFGDVASPLFQRIAMNAQESRTLAELRDTLLPKLISGELRVPEALDLVEAAT